MQRTCVISAKVTDTVWLFLMPFVRLLQKHGYTVKVMAGEGKYASALQENGLTLKIISYHFTLNPIKMLKMLIKTKKIFDCETPDLVICNDPSASFITRFAANRAGVNNTIYFCHGFPFSPHSNLLEKYFFYVLEKLASYVTDAAITMNDYDFNIGQNFFRKVYKINGVGVNLSQFNYLTDKLKSDIWSKLGIQKNSIVVAFIGRLVSKKGVRYYLNAAKEMIGNGGENINFLIAGDGPLKEEVKNFIKLNDLEERVKMLGYVDNIQNLLKVIDIMVLPTYYTEGLPRVILEAMASGVPVIATDIRGCQDIIDDGIDGILIPSKDEQSIVVGIERLIDDKQFYEKIRKNAYLKIRKRYSESVVLDQFDAYLKDYQYYKDTITNKIYSWNKFTKNNLLPSLIKVMYDDCKIDMIMPYVLDELISKKRIKKFLRSEGWVTISDDPIRIHNNVNNIKIERRKNYSYSIS